MSGILTISLLILLPVVGAFLPILTKRSILTVFPLIIALLIGVQEIIRSGEYISRFEWLPGFEMGWRLDGISLVLVSLVLFISLLVHVYSVKYIDQNEHSRYFLKLGFFTGSMVGLVLADHLILMFIFWELVGFASYLLIGFWYTKDSSSKSAKIAFIANRLADIALLASVIIIGQTDSFFFSELTQVSSTLVGLGIVIGAMGKSAQFPFSAWLPRAMTGPTPVSALIHAATMVVAGVYLLIRMSNYMNVETLLLVAIIGGLTALYGAFSAITQNDLKKILAYSTISQLGFMFLAVGVGGSSSALFHLWTHGFFKAGLFLVAGVLILRAGNQDIRYMGELVGKSKWLFVLLLIYSLSLVGIPLFSGFQSKEGILATVWDWSMNYGPNYSIDPSLLFYLTGLSVILTALYTVRMLLFIYFGRMKLDWQKWSFSNYYLIPLGILGLFTFWFMQALNPLSSAGWILGIAGFQEPIHGSLSILITSVALAGIGIFLGWANFSKDKKYSVAYNNWDHPTSLMGKMSQAGVGLDTVFSFCGSGYLRVSQLLYWVDKNVIDWGVNAVGIVGVVLSRMVSFFDYWVVDGAVRLLAWVSKRIGQVVTGTQSSQLQHQLFWMIIGLILILGMLLLF